VQQAQALQDQPVRQVQQALQADQPDLRVQQAQLELPAQQVYADLLVQQDQLAQQAQPQLLQDQQVQQVHKV